MGDKPLISSTYAALNQTLHDSRSDYGDSAGVKDTAAGAHSIIAMARRFKAASILDFGSGKGARARELRKQAPDITILEFDPAIPGKGTLPQKVDMVIAMDVMEHVEPEFLDNVLTTIRDLDPKVFVAMISVIPASKTLPDGRMPI